MSRRLVLTWLVAGLVMVGASGMAQQGLVLRDTGQVLLKDAEGDLATLELNLHNASWKYASQAEATVTVEAHGETGKRFTGTLAVPETPGAALSFVETVTPGEEGVKLLFELQPGGPMVLNGLQISLLLPAKRFAGERLIVSRPEEATGRSVILPVELEREKWQLGTYEGNAVQLGDQEGAVILGIDKTYGLVVQDLRRWERDEFEVRIPLLFANEGETVSNVDRWQVELTLGPGPFAVSGL
ncbi:MAG: hypothetical protein ACUVX8_03320 [Candidatus Zipacnadales bacterium]